MKKTMQQIKIPAKVNLSLEIIGVKGGLHTLKMETMAVDLYDEVCFEKTDAGKVDFAFGDTFDGFDENRFRPIIERVIDKFQANYGSVSGTLTIHKNVVLGAGIGGSSSAVVGVVKALEKLQNTRVDIRFLLSLGSDIPVVYEGGRNLVEGIGDIVTPLEFEQKYFVILVDGTVDSGKAYALFDEIGSERYGKRENHLEKSARQLNNGVKKAREILENAGSTDVVMSGSGSAMVAVFDNEDEAKIVFDKIEGCTKYLTKSVKK